MLTNGTQSQVSACLNADVSPSNADSQPQSNEQLISAVVAGVVFILFVAALAIVSIRRRRRSKGSPHPSGAVFGKQSDCNGAGGGDARGRNQAAAGCPATRSGELADGLPHRSGVRDGDPPHCSGTIAGEEASSVEIQLAKLQGTVRKRMQYCT